MRSFVKKQKATQQTKTTKPGRVHSGKSRLVRSIHHLQRTIGNQAVQRLLKANDEQLESRSASSASSGFIHDFSRIPLFNPSRVPIQIQPKLTVNTPGDLFEHEADRVADKVMGKTEPHTQRQTLGSRGGGTTLPVVSPIAHVSHNSSGLPLDGATRTFMESRFHTDFSQVRVHADQKSAESAHQVSALAYTVGHNIVFAAGQFQPHSFQGRRLIAHELTHVLQQTGFSTSDNVLSERINSKAPKVTDLRKPILQRLTSAHGQHVSGGQADLTADLTSPIVVGTSVRFESRWGYVPGIGVNERIRYYWAIYDRTTNNRVMSTVTNEPRAMLRYAREGQFRVVHQLLVGGPRTGALTDGARLVGSVSMQQDVVAEDSTVAQQSTDLRELVNSFRGYIIEAATSTGNLGITPLFLASVLRMEIENTTPLDLQNTRAYRLSEISGVESEIQNRESGQSFDPDEINRSVGVGQILLSTAAMLFGDIPWREQERTHRGVARRQIRRDFQALSASQQRDILTTLRWPKSNIDTAARLLARLKNRPNRYPTMTRPTFGTNQRAVEIIATEYNSGATTTPESSAGPSYYGQLVWNFMQDSFMQAQFPNV